MSRVKKIIALLVAVGVAVMAATTMASGSTPTSASSVPTGEGMGSGVAAAIGAFRAPVSTSDQAALKQFQESQAAAELSPDPTIPSNGADLAQARPASIVGSTAKVWIAPAGERVCAFIPMASGGYGVGCASLEAVKAGHAVSVIAKAAGESNASATVVAIVADGASGPSVVDAGGTRSSLPAESNVAAAVLPATDSVITGLGTVELSEFTAKAKLTAQ
jgi:hypothetical protein